MNQNKGIWIGVVSIIVIAALVMWWLSASRPLSTLLGSEGDVTEATSTVTDVTSPTGSTTKVVQTQVKTSQDIVSIIKSIKNATTFNAYFKSTGIAATINPKATNQYTVFVPTNVAFAQLPSGTVGSMTPEEKKRLIQYHVVSGRAIDVDAMTSGQIQALSGDVLNFNYGANKIPMVNSAIVVTQYQAKNGVVIVIDNVLLPPKRIQ